MELRDARARDQVRCMPRFVPGWGPVPAPRAWLWGVLLTASLLSACDEAAEPPGGDGGWAEDASDDAGATNPFDRGYPFDDTPEEILGEAIENPDTWTWIPIDGALCRDGSGTGFYARVATNSDHLLINLAGGGFCANPQSCAINPANARGTEKAMWDSNTLTGLNANSADNPFSGWNAVFVPYCTGDLHSGRARDVVVCEGLFCPTEPQQFVGHRNMELFLHVLRRYFPDLESVTLAGNSAGGFGTIFNYDQVATAFEGTPVALIDDAGPLLLSTNIVSECVEARNTMMWGSLDSLPKGCTECREPGKQRTLPFYLAETYPDRTFGFVSTLRDGFMVLGFNLSRDSSCPDAPEVTADTFEAALLEQYDALSATDNWGVMYLPGDQHVLAGTLGRDVGGLTVGAWMEDISSGTPTRVKPD